MIIDDTFIEGGSGGHSAQNDVRILERFFLAGEVMKIKRVKKPILELFYGYAERNRFMSEIEDPLNILIEKEKERQLSKKFHIFGDFFEQKKKN